ncbi:MAG: helix-turn-helix domain-containing protein [Pseudobdellovibrionaceae bacterium]
MKKWKENLKGLTSLEYISFENVPMRESKHGAVIDLDPEVLENLAAKAVIYHRIPLRGKEVKFLRKAIGLSLEKFAGQLGLTSGSVFHWEKLEEQRLAPVNEAAVRAFVAEKLGVKISGKFSLLLGDKIQKIKVKAS